MVTMFLALHDILEEAMGPTSFVSNTHQPACFDDGVWTPPTPSLVEAREPMWVKLNGGDAVLMESTCWHRGCANSSNGTRTLISVTLMAGSGRKSASGQVRVQDLIASGEEDNRS